ncbi:hypothetical protein BB560_005235 [Smittium megazygosporum]|uniref:39S ribosomal protein L50, mitochondrial n=1 Tax=Smittium megazygosporum TaxID=133381 RepID=A0A2T9Z708_9FUNG|nr:hypothetical protein BB560_005235 [Smittium megazygosporum]
MYRSLKQFHSSVISRNFHAQRVVNASGGGFLGRIFGRGKKEDTDSIETTASQDQKSVSEQGLSSEQKLDKVTGGEGEFNVIETIEEEADLKETFNNLTHNPVKNKEKIYTLEETERGVKSILSQLEIETGSDWKKIDIRAINIKEKIALASFQQFGKEIDSISLNNLQTVEDLVEYYSRKPDVKLDRHPVAKFFKSKDSPRLPKNMRFVPYKKGEHDLHAYN